MNQQKMRMIVGWIVVLLIFNLPLASALQLSNIRATDITANQAVIRWETDEAANSFVNYGTGIDAR